MGNCTRSCLQVGDWLMIKHLFVFTVKAFVILVVLVAIVNIITK